LSNPFWLEGMKFYIFLEPMDEMVAGAVGSYDNMRFQDVAKKGLLFGDEDKVEEARKVEEEEFKTRFGPLMTYLKKELEEGVSEVVISTRLTTSPCAVVADSYAWTGNMERLMAAQNTRPDAGETGQADFMTDFMRKAKRVLEINPRHPLIEGLLDKLIEDGDEDEGLRDNVRVLWDTSLVRSGFTLKDTNTYFSRIESLLRRSLGVSEIAQVDTEGFIRPAPPVETGPVSNTPDEPIGGPDFVDDPGQWKDWKDVKAELGHDEL